MQLFSGEKGLWSGRGLSPLKRVRRGGLSGLWMDSFCGGFA
jgi:hypothetical protein